MFFTFVNLIFVLFFSFCLCLLFVFASLSFLCVYLSLLHIVVVKVVVIAVLFLCFHFIFRDQFVWFQKKKKYSLYFHSLMSKIWSVCFLLLLLVCGLNFVYLCVLSPLCGQGHHTTQTPVTDRSNKQTNIQ